MIACEDLSSLSLSNPPPSKKGEGTTRSHTLNIVVVRAGVARSGAEKRAEALEVEHRTHKRILISEFLREF